MTKIQRISTYLLVFLSILLIAIPLLDTLQWICVDSETYKLIVSQGILLDSIHTPEGIVHLSDLKWTPLTKFLGLCASFIGGLPQYLSLYFLLRLFMNYKNGRVFTPTNARHIRSMGFLFFLKSLITTPLSDCLMIYVSTYMNPPGHRYMSLGFGSTSIEQLFFGIVLIVIAWVMLEASKLHDDQQLTV